MLAPRTLQVLVFARRQDSIEAAPIGTAQAAEAL